MRIQWLSAVGLGLWLASAAPASAQQEMIIGGFNPDEWKVGNQTGNRNQYVTEFVRPGEKIDSWSELLTAQTLRKSAYPGTVDEMAARTHQEIAKRCPETTINVIARQAPSATEESGMLYEWTVKNCPPDADQHEVARVIYGKFTIFRLAYVAKTTALAPEKREKWINDLKAAKIIVQR